MSHQSTERRLTNNVAAGRRPRIKPPEIVRCEANFLRFPFFALHTRGLRQVDGIECVARKRVGETVHESRLTVTRNTRHLYPGPLSRRIHFALLSLVQEDGLPYANPVVWSGWSQLTDRIGITKGGEVVAKLKDGIRRTAGVLITTNHALTQVVDGDRRLLPGDEHGYHLYDQYRFKNELLPDGSPATANEVWFSEWYLQNLNSLYSGPIDYETWRTLDGSSPIASRLYEFLAFQSRATSRVRIDYDTLAAFLPIRAERYRSQAAKQLRTPLFLAREHDVVDDVVWTTGRRGQVQLHIGIGPRLLRREPRSQSDGLWPECGGDVEVRELRNTDTRAAAIVRAFHHQWSDQQNYRPTRAELELAADFVREHGADTLERLLPKLVRRMRAEFPKAKSFAATRSYFPEVLGEDRRQREGCRLARLEAAEAAKADALVSRDKRDRKRRRERLLRSWEGLSEEQRTKMAESARNRQPKSLRGLFDRSEEHRLRACLDELDRSGVPRTKEPCP